MGCGPSVAVGDAPPPTADVPQPVAQSSTGPSRTEETGAAPAVGPAATKASQAEPAPAKKAKRVPVGQLPDDPAEKVELEYLTPMLLIPFLFFVQLGRIPKSTKPWREEARSKGWLVEYRREDGKIVIFISQTWWDREYLDPDRDPNDKFDVGGPDWQSGKKKNLKWRIIVAGVERLIEEKGLEASDVMLWMDWPCIYQARPAPAAPPPRPAHPRRAPRRRRTTRRRSSRASRA
ncbi:MAG: hypothetical protein VXW31_07875 [Planctomycetota bacterium]|nr:hypothetical protein [Planctomycetota bacterium]